MEKERSLMRGKEGRKITLFIVVFASSFIYIVWRLLFTLPLNHVMMSLIWGIILWIAESGTTVEAFWHFFNASYVKIPDMPELPKDMYPDIDVLICTHNESKELLYKTLNGCKYMEYPDKSKVHVYLCDDGNRPEIQSLSKEMGVGYFGFDGNKEAKAGNLNHALPQTFSPLVAIFDADMIPRTRFLMETVPYFFLRDMVKEGGAWRVLEPDEPREGKILGYVQTMQSFYNPDPLQRNLYMEKDAPNEQDYFYRAVNVARSNSDSAAFAGSNTVFLRKALEEAGGFATYSITEDLATSIPILSLGYTSLAVDKELAHGMSPEDAFSFIKQRKRWSRGSAQVIPNMRFLRSKLPLKSKWSFIVSYFYWWTFIRRFIYLLSPILYGVFGIAVADVSLWNLLAVWLPYYIVYNAGLRYMSGGTINALWSSIMDTIQFPYLMCPVIAGTLKVPEKNFWVTPKDKVKGRNSSLRLATPQIILIVLSLMSAVVCVRHIFIDRYDGAVIVLFWLCYNLFCLFVSLVYYCGRENEREYQRIPAQVTATLRIDERKMQGRTVYVSDDSMAILLKDPEYLPPDKELLLTLEDRNYTATMKVKLVHVLKVRSRWRYSFIVTELTEADKSEYMQIIYDRDHSFSRKINVNIAVIVKRIFRGLTYKKPVEKRQLPHIDISFPLYSPEVGDVESVSFNYKYIVLKAKGRLPEEMTLQISKSISMTCIRVSDASFDRSGETSLYQIEDWEKMAVNPLFRQFLFELLAER